MEQEVSRILDGLNDEQRRAVQCVDGPVIIVAGAGSGKTKVLTGRVAFLVASGVDASSIMALTFTKKAAEEMKERIYIMVGPKAKRVVMGTFHSIFIRFLREYSAYLGYPEQFTIYDTSDSQSALKACIKELGLDDKIYKPRDVLARISMAKNNLVTVSGYRSRPELLSQDQRARKPRIVDLYDLYQKKMKTAGVMDFDDILVNMNILLRDNPDALQSISSRFTHIMVDEYQDTNFAQYLILKKLSQPHRNICVVGDDSQSIYAFRGAKIENILNFRKDYPESKIFRLERNYRSTSTIVEAANSLIAHNEGRIPKNCYSEAGEGEKIKLVKCYSEKDEAARITSQIKSRINAEHAQYKDFAILYRTNAQSRVLEEYLRNGNIPYLIYSGNSFFERAEVKDLMAYFKLAVNPSDDESFKRVVNKPARGIGDTSVSALNECARANGCSLFKAAFMPDTERFGLKSAALEKIRKFCAMIDSFAVAAPLAEALELAQRISDESTLYAFYKADLSIEGMSRTANVEELINSVASFVADRENEMSEMGEEPHPVTLGDYLENVSLLSSVDIEDDESDNKVALMTVHAAKGLEFPFVHIAGMEENIFPSMVSVGSPRDIEEERRLFYVAITRAKKAVSISFAESRLRNGKTESNNASRFIREIDAKYLDNPGGFDDDFEPSVGSRPLFGWRQASRPAFGAGRPSGAGRQTFRAPEPSPLAFRSPEPQSSRQAAPTRPAFAPKPALIDPDFRAVPPSQLYVGERIEHDRFGAGKILSIDGSIAAIEFDAYGLKKMMLGHAKIRPEKK